MLLLTYRAGGPALADFGTMYPSQRLRWVDRTYIIMSITCFLQDVLSNGCIHTVAYFVCPTCFDLLIIMIFIWWLIV